MDEANERAGKVSLVLAIIGMLLPGGGLVTLFVAERNIGQTYGGMILFPLGTLACCALLVILQAIALVYGVVGRNTPAGKAGLCIASLSFALLLLAGLALFIIPVG